MGGALDLNAPPANHTVKLEPEENAEDRKARHAQEAKDAWLRRLKDGLLFVVTLVAVFVLLAGCAWIAFGMGFENDKFKMLTAPTPEDRKWAMSALTLGLGGMIGFLVRPSGK